jgi:hypothetical protein
MAMAQAQAFRRLLNIPLRISSAVAGTLTIPELIGIIRKAEKAAQGEDNEP